MLQCPAGGHILESNKPRSCCALALLSDSKKTAQSKVGCVSPRKRRLGEKVEGEGARAGNVVDRIHLIIKIT